MLFDFFKNAIGSERPFTWILQFWPVLVLSFIASLTATWFCKKVALKFGIVDRPDNLVKTHKAPIAYLGGVGMFVGLSVGILSGLVCLRHEEIFFGAFKLLLGIIAGGSVACFIGLADDIFDIRPSQKIIGQVFAAIILLVVGILPNLSVFSYVFKISISQTF
ncbi:MAG: hypothetical protein ACYTE8_12890, partial [Planctomycetota bacterium]